MYHSRRLPHIFYEGSSLFITWHLYGSLPRERYPPSGKMNSGAAFVWMDRYLDTTTDGPRWLALPEIAKVVEMRFKGRSCTPTSSCPITCCSADSQNPSGEANAIHQRSQRSRSK